MHPTRPLLNSARLVLRPVALGDVDAMQSYRGREDVVRFLTHEALSPAAMRARVAQALELWAAYPAELFNLNMVVELRDADDDGPGAAESTGEVIGDLRVWNLLVDGSGPATDSPSIFWVGYAFHPDMQGKGYAGEAVARVIRWLFEEHAAREVRAIAWTPNTPSIRLLEKQGFRVFRELSAEEEDHPKKLPAVHLRIDAGEWRARTAAPTSTAPTESEES